MDRPVHNRPALVMIVRSKSLDSETVSPIRSPSYQKRDPQIHYHHKQGASLQHYKLQNTPKEDTLPASKNKI